MPKPNTVPENATPEDYLLAAARRLIAARANPKLDWGQKKAVEEEAFAFHTLTESVKLYDVTSGLHIEVFNISPDEHKLFVANGKTDFIAEGNIEELLSPSRARAYAKKFKCALEDILVTEYDLYGNDPARPFDLVAGMSAEKAYGMAKKLKIKPYYRKRPWVNM